MGVADLWGAGDLFTKAFLYAEKMKSVRFLVPLLEKKNGGYVSVGFACTNWHGLREVEDPKKCVEKITNLLYNVSERKGGEPRDQYG